MTASSACVPVLRPCGDAAWLLDLDDNRLVHAGRLRAHGRPAWRMRSSPRTDHALGDPRSGRHRRRHTPRRSRRTGAQARDGARGRTPRDRGDLRRRGPRRMSLTSPAYRWPNWWPLTPAWRGGWRSAVRPGFSYLVGGDPRLRVPRATRLVSGCRPEPSQSPASLVDLPRISPAVGSCLATPTRRSGTPPRTGPQCCGPVRW